MDSLDFLPLTDSRSLSPLDAARTIFFALRTPTGDGHRFIPHLIESGVRHFVVGDDFDTAGFPAEVDFRKVADPLAELQRLAAIKRGRFNHEVVGVTGSRGKTMVKEALAAALAPDMTVCRNPGSYNSQIGVPLSVWRLGATDDIAIFEAGISMQGEMAALQATIKPTIAIVTTIRHDHDEGFESRRQKIDEKLLLAREANCIIYNADEPDLDQAVRNAYANRRLLGCRRVRQLADAPAESSGTLDYAVDITGPGGAALTYRLAGAELRRVQLPFAEGWQIENAVLVLAALLVLGYTPAKAEERLSALPPMRTRTQVSAGVNGSMIIHDDYPCDMESLALALEFASRRRTPGQRFVVVMPQPEPERDDRGNSPAAVAAQMLRGHNVDRVVSLADINAFLDDLLTPAYAGTLVLVKGATPGTASPGRLPMADILHRLEAKTHETVLEVNLDAVVDNYNFFRSKLHADTGIVAMVKASGYGAGALELAKTLQDHGAAYLAVAVGDEGEELRRAGITMPIMVLNPIVQNYKQLFDNRLEPEVFSFESLDEIISEATAAGVTDYPVHIKIDSGMHRLGFRKEDMPQLIERLKAQSVLRPRSVFSHLATADCLDMDSFTRLQLDYYTACSQMLVDAFPFKILRHVLNTAGILRFPEYQYDMVRLGIGLYGIPILNNGMEDALRPVSSLKSVVIALRELPAGQGVGYGLRSRTERPSLIATVPIGYADGFNRRCSRGQWKVMVNGVACPTMGNICMDICMVDVTDVPSVRLGDTVTIFGPANPATEMAALLGTIPYEVLTSVSPRVRRVYYRES